MDAVSYFDSDFPWEELVNEGAARYLRQKEEQQASKGLQAFEDDAWESFYKIHENNFFANRRYLVKEFPVLAKLQRGQRILDVGAGVGNACMQLRQNGMEASITAVDVSKGALGILEKHSKWEPREDKTFYVDLNNLDVGGGDPDSMPERHHAAVACFTLSAILPEKLPRAIAWVLLHLESGSDFCIRDYGLYDMTMLRFPGASLIGEHLYARQDGTLAYFFTPKIFQDALHEVKKLYGVSATIEEAKYCTVENRNRKTGGILKRVFVHVIIRKTLNS
mmetsp:Transcript_27269/g.70223  ORF Transcript_27269/g.70223 Transcript_27269/m.70223 type:complete len:278 (-) Transcript_27269:26-859(-)